MPFYYEQPQGGFSPEAARVGLDPFNPVSPQTQTEALLDQLDPFELLELQNAVAESRRTRDASLAFTQQNAQLNASGLQAGLANNERAFERNYALQRFANAGNGFRNAGGFDQAVTDQFRGLATNNEALNRSFYSNQFSNAQSALSAEQAFRDSRRNAELSLSLELARLGEQLNPADADALFDLLFGAI